MKSVLTWCAVATTAAVAVAACGGDDNATNGPVFDDAGAYDASLDDAQGQSDAGSDASFTLDAGGDAAKDATIDGGVDATAPDAAMADAASLDATSTDASVEAGPDATPDATPDASPDAGPDATADASPDAAQDAGVEASADASPIDASLLDAGADGSTDAALDVTVDAPTDAPTDAIAPQTTMLAVGVGASGSIVANYTGSWSASASNALSVDAPAIAFVSPVTAVAAVHYERIGDPLDNTLQYATWQVGAWSTFAQVSNYTTRAAPSLARGAGNAFLLFQGSDYRYYETTWSSGTWGAVAASNLAGPVTASITALTGSETMAFLNGGASNALTTADLVGPSWQASVNVYNDVNINVPPTMATFTASGQTVPAMAWVRGSDNQLLVSTRVAGMWAPASPVPNAFTQQPAAIAELAVTPGAIVAFRGNDGNLYYAVSSPSGWSQATSFATPNVAIASPPSLATGVGGDAAEIAFVQTDGVAYHARFDGATWSTPVAIGGTGLTSVAIATSP